MKLVDLLEGRWPKGEVVFIPSEVKVYNNPARPEIIDATLENRHHEYRWIADRKTKTVYIWGTPGGEHEDVAWRLDLPNPYIDHKRLLMGIGWENKSESQNDWKIKESHWQWANKYLPKLRLYNTGESQ